MSNLHFRIWLLPATLVLAMQATAQQKAADTVLKGSTIEVIQKYKPQVKRAPKPEWVPELPKVDTTHPDFVYEVPQQTLYYSYSAEPIRPVALGVDSGQLPKQGYVKAAAGNLSTFLLDAGSTIIDDKAFKVSGLLHHISQKGAIKNQQTSLTSASIAGLKETDNYIWKGSLDFSRNRYAWYGYDHDLFQYNNDISKQVFTSFGAKATMISKTDYHGFTWQPGIGVSYYKAKVDYKEFELDLDAPVQKQLDSNVTLRAVLFARTSNVNGSGINAGNTLIGIKPGIELNQQPLTGHAYIGLAAGTGKGYILPDIKAAYRLLPFLQVGAGWEASIRRNTLRELTGENPYLAYISGQTQSRNDEVFGSVTLTAGKHFLFSGRVAWWSFANMPVYYNTGADFRKFSVGYIDVNAIALSASARYIQPGIWSAGITATQYNYFNIPVQRVWQQPSVIVKGDVSVRPVKKLNVNGYLNFLQGIYATDQKGGIELLSPVFDLDVAGEYEITGALSAFAQINNLLNVKYERWYGYSAYGLNVFAGVRLKF